MRRLKRGWSISVVSTTSLLVSVLLLCCLLEADSATPGAVIYSAPTENVTVPLGQNSLVTFYCRGDGVVVQWVINGTSVATLSDQSVYQERGITFPDDMITSMGFNISVRINVTTASSNNTEFNCRAIGGNGTVNSTIISLTIAGPPLTPCPKFHVMNATHIEVQWDKPFALPEYDIKNYNLTIVNTSSDSDIVINELFRVSASATYPIRHFINNGGDIPKECVHLIFNLTATSDAGTSDAGSVTGGFPIVVDMTSRIHNTAPSPIPDSLQYEVTFTNEFIPTLDINFTFPEVCDYHDAKYSVQILSGDGSSVYHSMEKTYDNNSPDNVEVKVSENLEKDMFYTAEIKVSTAVNWTTVRFLFNTSITPLIQPPTGSIRIVANNQDTIIIISSSAAAGLLAILVGLIIILMTVFVMRRRKLEQRNRAQQRELETDEAVQRAAQAMIPNPIYSNPIYEEIVDSTHMLKSLRNGAGVHETTLRDEGYVAISADAVINMTSFLLPEESKLVEDKYAAFPEDTYTVMNPAGTLSSQTSRGPAYEVPAASTPCSMHNGNVALHEERPIFTEIATAMNYDGHCAASASAPNTTGFRTLDEERYVKGAF